MQEAPILATQIDTHEEHVPSFGFRGHLQASGRHLRRSVGPLHVFGRASDFHIYIADFLHSLVAMYHTDACMHGVTVCFRAAESVKF